MRHVVEWLDERAIDSVNEKKEQQIEAQEDIYDPKNDQYDEGMCKMICSTKNRAHNNGQCEM